MFKEIIVKDIKKVTEEKYEVVIVADMKEYRYTLSSARFGMNLPGELEILLSVYQVQEFGDIIFKFKEGKCLSFPIKLGF